MGYLYASTFLSYTPTATTAHSDYPVTRLADLAAHPYLRAWRSTAVTLTDLTLDLGSDQSVGGIALFNVNATSCELAFATAAGSPSYTGWGPNAAQPSYQITQNTPGPYYNLCVTEPITARYIRVRFPASTARHTTDAYYSVGCIVVVGAFLPIQTPRVGMVERLQSRYLENAHLVTRTGEEWSEEEWDAILLPENKDSGFAVMALGKAANVVMFRNQGDRAEVKLMRRTGDIQVAHNATHYTTQQTWREHT